MAMIESTALRDAMHMLTIVTTRVDDRVLYGNQKEIADGIVSEVIYQVGLQIAADLTPAIRESVKNMADKVAALHQEEAAGVQGKGKP